MLADGYMVYPNDDIGRGYCQTLRALKLIDVEEEIVHYCINPKDRDYKSLSSNQKRCDGVLFANDFQDGLLECPKCGREIWLHEKIAFDTAWQINLKIRSISKFVKKFLNTIVDEVIEEKKYLQWKVNCNSISGIITILDYMPLKANYQYLISETSGFLGIILSNQKFKITKSRYRLWNIVSLEEIIFKPDYVKELLKGTLSKAPSLLKVEEINQEILTYVSQLDKTGRSFEEFCRDLESKVFQDTSKIKSLLRAMKSNELLLYRPLILSGSGRPDIVRLPLYDFLLDYLTKGKSIEVKQFVTSKFTISHMAKAILHAKRIGEERVIIYTTAKKIPVSIWEDVLSVKHKDGGYTYLIIDTYMMAYLIANLGIENILQI